MVGNVKVSRSSYVSEPEKFGEVISHHNILLTCTVVRFIVDLRVTWVCIHDLTWHQNDLKVD